MFYINFGYREYDHSKKTVTGYTDTVSTKGYGEYETADEAERMAKHYKADNNRKVEAGKRTMFCTGYTVKAF